MEGYEIRRYRPGDEEGILRSFNRVFRDVCGEGYVDRDLTFWRWEFEDGPGGHRITVGIAQDGEVAAHYGGVVYPMRTSYGPAAFVHIVDSYVLPEHRAGLKRPGLFVTTAYPWFELCHEMGDAVMYGYPVPTAERIGRRYLEYKFLHVVDYLCRPSGEGSVAVPGGVEVERVAAAPADLDALFDEFVQGEHCLTERNAAYSDWRYVRMPGGAYEPYAARRGGELCGWMVLRPVHELVPGACTVADWVVPPADEETVDALLATVTRRARDLGRATVMAVFPPWSAEKDALLARGFGVEPSSSYLERRLTHRIYHPRMTSEWLGEHWWYTLGDSDLV